MKVMLAVVKTDDDDAGTTLGVGWGGLRGP